MKDIVIQERIILALDVPHPELAKEWVRKTESHIRFFKVGLQLFLADSFRIVDWLTGRGHKVMLDLKFFDIPQTVKLAVAQIRDRGVTFLTVHGNDPILRAAIEEKGDLRILAVTVLTSFDEEDMRTMGMTRSIEDLFNIANNFGIRHHKPGQKTDYDRDIWLPWMFYIYLATLRAVTKTLAKQIVPPPGGEPKQFPMEPG